MQTEIYLDLQDVGFRVLLLTTTKTQPTQDNDFSFVTSLDLSSGKWEEDSDTKVKVKLPKEVTKKNGTLYLAAFTSPAKIDNSELTKGKWKEAVRHPDTTFSLVPLTAHKVPEAATFNLLGGGNEDSSAGIMVNA